MVNRRQFLTALAGATALPAVAKPLELEGLPSIESSQALAADPLRPQFHLLPASNWMNDPNGPVHWNGKYHMFYQYNPSSAVWGDMHWGHAISEDMVHWKHLPVALAPTPGGPDSNGCFTGTALVDDGKVYLMYTGVRSAPADAATIKDGVHSLQESQCLAFSDDPELRAWVKIEKPVIANPPAELQINGFRDPSPWRQDGSWYTVIGSGIAHDGGAVLLYRSNNLHQWEFVHVLAKRNPSAASGRGPVDPWEVWECPEFFALGDWHVLICSTLGKAYWQCGKLDPSDMTFHPEQIGVLDYGSYYAPKTQLDKAGNRILWGWVQESRSIEEYKSAGWAGLMSLPRVLSATSNGQLRMAFAPEIEEIRQLTQDFHPGEDEETTRRKISAMELKSCCGEILLAARRGSEPFEATLCGSDDADSAWLSIRYDPAAHDQIFIEARPIPLQLSDEEKLELHFYVDGSVIELIVNGQIAWTRRFYYSGSAAKALRIKWSGKTASIQRLSFWQIAPISNDRLTS